MEELDIEQAFKESNVCTQLKDDLRHARAWIQEQHDQVQSLLNKIDQEQRLQDNLRQQRQRTGDDGFDADIAQQDRIIENLRQQIEDARTIAHRWEGEADIIERQLIGNDCGSFA